MLDIVAGMNILVAKNVLHDKSDANACISGVKEFSWRLGGASCRRCCRVARPSSKRLQPVLLLQRRPRIFV